MKTEEEIRERLVTAIEEIEVINARRDSGYVISFDVLVKSKVLNAIRHELKWVLGER